ncbi:MAG: signal peptidase II [Thermodesulfobacteriota bacterium]
MSERPSYWPLILWGGGVVALDQFTKWLIQANFLLHDSREIIPGFFNLTYVTNTGAAFGILAGEQSTLRMLFFVAIAVVALAVIILGWRQLCGEQRLMPHALGLIAGGAVGNLIDRVRFGAVVDFLDVYVNNYHWPAFNVADSAICVGVGLFLLGSFFSSRSSQNAA